MTKSMTIMNSIMLQITLHCYLIVVHPPRYHFCSLRDYLFISLSLVKFKLIFVDFLMRLIYSYLEHTLFC